MIDDYNFISGEDFINGCRLSKTETGSTSWRKGEKSFTVCKPSSQ